MEWVCAGATFEQSDAGYRMAVARVGGAVWFSAFAPPLPDGQYEARLKVQYALGEPVPQARELIGSFQQAREARQACEAHHKLLLVVGG